MTYVHFRGRWHKLSSAFPGGNITALCGASGPANPVLIATMIPADQRCSVCEPDPDASSPVQITEDDELSDGTPQHEQLTVTTRGGR